MNFIDKISSEQLDILKEIGNIGAGHAATALSMMMNKKIDMKVPSGERKMLWRVFTYELKVKLQVICFLFFL